MDKIKELIASPQGREYEIATLVTALLALLNIFQNSGEPFANYQARLETTCEATHARVDLVPKTLPDGVDKDKFKEALKAYLLLKGGLNESFGDLKKLVRVNHSAGNGTYHTTMDGMASFMIDHLSAKPKKPRAPTPAKEKGERDSTPKTNNLQTNQVDTVAPPRRSRLSTPTSHGAFQPYQSG